MRCRIHRALSTPSLLIYTEMIEANITAALRMMNGDASRWRPHLKTAKLGYTMRRLVARGIKMAKCATTLELVAAIESGMEDVVVAFPLMGPNAARVREIAAAHPERRISTLVESVDQIDEWRASAVGVFVDLNPGMDRTGMAEDHFEEVRELDRSGSEGWTAFLRACITTMDRSRTPTRRRRRWLARVTRGWWN